MLAGRMRMLPNWSEGMPVSSFHRVVMVQYGHGTVFIAPSSEFQALQAANAGHALSPAVRLRRHWVV